MTVADSRINLAALRKLYFRLEKSLLSRHAFLQKSEALGVILLAEGVRRILRARSVSFDRLSFASTAQQLISQVKSSLSDDINGAIRLDHILGSGQAESPGAAHDDAAPAPLVSIAYDLLSVLQKNSEILDQFDERFAGYFYQYSCESLRDEALERIQSADKKSSTQDLISFTQLYTPDWVADFLLISTLVSLWSGGASKCNLPTTINLELIPPAGRLLGKSADALTIMDPACGAGHILLRSFELLLLMHTSEGGAIEESVLTILNKNLGGCDLDLSALWVCGFSIIVKAMTLVHSPFQVSLNLQSASKPASETREMSSAEPAVKKKLKRADAKTVSADTSTAGAEFDAGSLQQDFKGEHLLARKYDVVVANPPYIGRRLMDRRMKLFLKQNFPTAHNDISAAFLVRALQLCKSAGKVAFITQSSLLYLPSFGQVRKEFIAKRNVETVVELGTRVFPLAAGEKINSMLIVLNAAGLPVGQKSSFLDLSRSANKFDELKRLCRFWQDEPIEAKPQSPVCFVNRDCDEFIENRESAFNYKCPRILLEIIQRCKRLDSIAEIKQGLATSDNKRFVRFWWDTLAEDLGRRWHPYIKGAGTERWLSSCQTVLDWGSDGQAIKEAVEINYPYLKGKIAWVVKNEQYYFKPGLTFSFVSTGNFAVRRMPAACIFDVGGSALFCEGERETLLLAYLNSSFVAVCAQLLNPTFNFQVGDIKEIPLPEFSVAQHDELLELSNEACKLKETLLSFDESNLFAGAAVQIKQALCGEDIERVWQAVDKQQRGACLRLATLEQNLDNIVWQVLSNKHSFSAAENLALQQLLDERCQARKPEALAFASASEFARALLRAYMIEISRDCPVTNVDLTIDRLQPLKSWCEPHIGQNLSTYFKGAFNQDQEKTFLGSPRLLIYFDNVTQKHFCLSNTATRKLLLSPAKPLEATDIFGANAINRIADKLKCIDNWTGKDFYATAQSIFSANRV